MGSRPPKSEEGFFDCAAGRATERGEEKASGRSAQNDRLAPTLGDMPGPVRVGVFGFGRKGAQPGVAVLPNLRYAAVEPVQRLEYGQKEQDQQPIPRCEPLRDDTVCGWLRWSHYMEVGLS